MTESTNPIYKNKGWFWDHINQRMYRWHELDLLMKERTLKENKNADKLKNQGSNI